MPVGALVRRGSLLGGVLLSLLATILMSVPASATPEASAPVTSDAAAPAGPVIYPSGVGADLGPTPTTLGMSPSAGPDPAGLQTGSAQGRPYWKTNHAAGTDYLAFDLDDDYVDQLTTKDVTVAVTYLDSGSGALSLHYDATGDPETAATDVPLTNSGQWRTGVFLLSDVAFGDRLHDADISVSGTSAEGVVDVTVSKIRVGSAGASVELGPTPVAHNIVARAGDRAEGLVTGEQSGRGYWQTNRAAPSPATLYFYMNVADTYAYDTRNTVLVSVDYFDAGNGGLGLQYDSPGGQLADMFKNTEAVRYGDSGTWKTHTFTLDDAVMTNRSNGSDFRVTTGGSNVEVKVAAVRVTVVAAHLDAKEGLNALIEEAARAHRSAHEGDRDGQFPPGSKADLQAAINRAQAVTDDPAATETQIKAQAHALFDVLTAFRASVVDTNLARGATATASSAATGAGPELAVDSDQTTAWTSGSGRNGEWLQVDLGQAQPVNEVRVLWGAAYSSDYTVQLSTDGTTFTEVGRTGSPSGSRTMTTPFATTSARFVRVTLEGYAGQNTTFGVNELQVRDRREVRPNSTLVRTVHPTEDGVVADFDVTAYGADRTGAKDSTKAIQQALYDCYDAGGGTVWMPAGTYRVTDTLEVFAFCTLRGDRRDPDIGKGSYGTVVVADLASGDDGPTLFRIGGSAGVMGVTTYYPRQNASDPVPYNYTFEIPGGAWIGNENYMMSTVSDVTMLNSYRGIGVSTMANDRGEAPSGGQVHESTTVRNVKGTALFEGARAYNGADVGTWENITFSNDYWAQAPAAYQPPARATLDAWTRANGTGFALGDLEWEQLYRLKASDYKIGIHIVPGQRISFAGSFLQTEIRRTDIALRVESFDSRWGLVLAGGSFEGSQRAIDNGSQGFVKVTGTTLTGGTAGIVHVLQGRPPSYIQLPLPAPQRAVLYDVSKAPYNATRGVGYLPAQDATARIQQALDQAGSDGGGIVYLPAGWYRIETHLRVPANVELRGASAVPNRDQNGRSGGTVLLAYEGRGTAQADTATALVTLDGRRSGVRGLRVFYPENNPAAPEGLVPYPFAIRGNGEATYVVNVGMPNAWNGVDLATNRNDNFVVRKLTGAFFRHAVTVGEGERGRIEGLLSNGNAVMRVGYGVPNWANEGNVFPQVIDKYMRKQSELVTVDGASRLTVFDAFAYGFHDGLVVESGEVTAFNLGTDNLGEDGHTVAVTDGSVTATNVLRYNGATLRGPARLLNIMAINMAQRSVSVTASPAGAGSVSLAGNETERGRYELGSEVTASARPASGHAFVNWTVNGQVVSTASTYSFTVTADQVLTANFSTGGS
ncbi:discoidin domain-containing protein [Actinopolymorpha pittospori]